MSLKVSSEVDLRSLRRDLKTLRQLEPDYRKTVPDRMKAAAQPMLAAAKAAVPADAPTSGWSTSTTSRMGWRPARIRQRMVLRFRTSGFKAAAKPNDVVLRMVAKGAAMSVFDMAKHSHRPNTVRWVSTLNTRYGSPSRVMWRTAEQYLPAVRYEVARVMAEISHRADSAIRRNTP